MKKIIFLSFLFSVFFQHFCFAQNGISKVHLIQQMDHFANEDPSLLVENFFTEMAMDFRLAPESKMELQKTEHGFNGMEHFKFQQTHNGIPVFGATYILHCQDEKVKNSNGYFRPLLDVNTIPDFSAEEALDQAMRLMNASSYIWDSPLQKQFPKEYEKPQAELVLIDPAFPKISDVVLLAFKVDLHSWIPLDKQRYFIDARNGQLIKQFPLMLTHAVPAKGVTKYYGEQNIIVDSIGPNKFYLQDLTRGDGIKTQNHLGETFQHHSNHWDLTNEQQDEVALDAHYCATKHYDLLQNYFQWSGLDNNGESLTSLVHLNNGANVVNAYWNGSHALFGDGDCNNGPLTTLGVVGHEFTHGLIQRTSDLIYSSESGAINESLADVFGKFLEYTENPTDLNWDIGWAFRYRENDLPFRSMENPVALGDPDFYKGALWIDDGNVHTNSSVGNHWFYLLSVGETGINENNEAYDITGIGLEKAAAIIFLTNRAYLNSDSDYTEYYLTSILAAEELYGIGAAEIVAVEQAWKAVGLPNSLVNTDGLDLGISISEEFQFLKTCQASGFVPVEFTVSNLGNEIFVPVVGDRVEAQYVLSPTFKEIEIPLTETMTPGQSITFVLDTFLYADGYGVTNINYKLKVTGDQKIINDTAFPRYKNFSESFNELFLVSPRVDYYDCLNEVHKAQIFILNSGCEAFPSNQEFELLLKNKIGQTVWSKTTSLEDSLASERFATLSTDISFDVEDTEYTMYLIVPGDPNTDNNEQTMVFWEAKSFDLQYSNGFNIPDSLDGQMQVQTDFAPPVYLLDNESYLMGSGKTKTLTETPCFLPEGNLDGGLDAPVNGIYSLCFDFSEVKFPVLEFDLIQFRNDSLAAPFAASTMMKVSWEGTESGEQIIYGQEEGQLVHHQIKLPDYFVGGLEVKFSNFTGTDVNDPNFLDYDVNLLDNLSFFEDTDIAVSEIRDDHPIKIIPNPVSDQLTIENGTLVKALSVINIYGQVLFSDPNYNNLSVDLSQFPDTFYYLSVWNEKRKKTIIPFVKISP